MDNRDLQSQLDKASKESEIKPFTIQDLIRFAERDGINCENCAVFHKSELIDDYGKCRKNGHHPSIIEIRGEHKNHFCADFKPKDKIWFDINFIEPNHLQNIVVKGTYVAIDNEHRPNSIGEVEYNENENKHQCLNSDGHYIDITEWVKIN
jgi:hypothetical protein